MHRLSWIFLLALAVLASCGDGATADRPPELRTVRVDGLNFAYFERGTGPLVILLHGFPDNAHTWDSIAPRLAAEGFRTVAPFLRGYPPTEAPAEDDFTILRLGRDVVGLIEALGASSAIVIGHDWGALATYAAANLAPSRIDRIVTLGIPHPGAVARHPETLADSPHFARFAQPDAATALRADDFAELERLIGVWAPTWDVPSDFLVSVKATLSPPGALEATLGYYRDFGSLDPLLFQPSTVPGLSLAHSIPCCSNRARFRGSPSRGERMAPGARSRLPTRPCCSMPRFESWNFRSGTSFTRRRKRRSSTRSSSSSGSGTYGVLTVPDESRTFPPG